MSLHAPTLPSLGHLPAFSLACLTVYLCLRFAGVYLGYAAPPVDHAFKVGGVGMTTTEAFVLDAKRTLVYRGAVDDQYGFGYTLNAPRRTYLRGAMDAVLAGQAPDISATSAPGCELWIDDEETSH